MTNLSASPNARPFVLTRGIAVIAIALLAFVAVSPRSALSFELAGGMWRTMPVTYCVNPAGAPVVDGEPIISDQAFVKTVDTAFKTWQDDPNSSLKFISAGICAAVPGDRDELNVVGWSRQRTTQGGLTDAALSKTKYLRGGSAKEIFEADIAVNSRDELLAKGTDVYLSNVLPFVLLHETGHFIGLDHTNVKECAVMTPRSLQPTLCADDLAGAAWLYP